MANQTSANQTGLVEVCINNTYGAVCDDFWDKLDASVACSKLGFSNGKKKFISLYMLLVFLIVSA